MTTAQNVKMGITEKRILADMQNSHKTSGQYTKQIHPFYNKREIQAARSLVRKNLLKEAPPIFGKTLTCFALAD